MTTTERTTWQLARLADCADPDNHDSPGAQWLHRIADNLGEARERIEQGEDASDVIHEIADAAVPIYTHERWRVFVDLAAYNEDVTELGGTADDLTAAAGIALYMIAERLLGALLADDDEPEADDDE